MQKHAFGKKALTLLLTLCMVFTTIAPAASSVVYADSVSDHTGSSSVSSVDPGNASSVATGGEEQNSGSSSTPTQSQPDSTSNSTSVPAADGGGSDSTSAPPANSSSVPTDNGEETSSSSTSEIPEDSSAPENEDGTGEDESEEDKESEGDNSAEEFIPLAIIDPETGDVIEAEVGDEVTLSSLLNRDDILVSYQWQRMQQPTKRVAANIKPIYDYADGEATWYSFPLEEKTEAETLRDNPEAKWYGIEMYYAIIKHYEACAAYVSKYITKQLADLAKSKHLYFCSQGLKKPELVFDEDGVPFPFEQAEHEDEYCRISWATGEQLIGTMLPEWYDEWASDVRDPEQLPAGMTRAQLEQYIFEPLTGEQLSLLESAEQVPVPWDM